MNYFRLIIAICTIFGLINCSSVQSRQQTAALSALTWEKNYQVRVRTGNLAMDRIVYRSSYAEFGKYLPVSEKGPFTGLIDVTFTSKTKKGVWSSTSGYETNVLYGNSWYTGSDAKNPDEDYNAEREESIIGSLLAWQKSTMIVTISDMNGDNLWDASYTYTGGQDVSGLYVKASDDAAKQCLEHITAKLAADYDIKTGRTKIKPKMKGTPMALILSRTAGEVKSDTSKRWSVAGKNINGSEILIDMETIAYPSPDVVRVWTKTGPGENSYLGLVEINCTNHTFRFIKGHMEPVSSLTTESEEWQLISPETTPELLFNTLCSK